MHKFKNEPYSVFIDESVYPIQIESSLLHISNIKNKNQKLITVIGIPEENLKNFEDIGKAIASHADIIILAPNNTSLSKTHALNSQIQNSLEEFRGRVIERIDSSDELELINNAKLFSKIKNTLNNNDLPVISFDANDYTGRFDAIKLSTNIANKNDIIYIVGKGANTSISFNNIEYEWSDYEALRLALKSS